MEENLISKKYRVVKMRPFTGTTTEKIHNYIKPLLKKQTVNVILRVGTDNTPRE